MVNVWRYIGRFLWVVMIIIGYISTYSSGSREWKVVGKIMFIGNGTRVLQTDG